MGKATRPLTILLTDKDLLPHLADLIAKGHQVDIVDGPAYDRVIGPNCYRLTPLMLDTLPKNTLAVLVKEARLEKYGPTTKRKAEAEVRHGSPPDAERVS